MSIKSQIAACAALLGLACASTAVLADDHAFTDGPVVNVAAVRTERPIAPGVPPEAFPGPIAMY